MKIEYCAEELRVADGSWRFTRNNMQVKSPSTGFVDCFGETMLNDPYHISYLSWLNGVKIRVRTILNED